MALTSEQPRILVISQRGLGIALNALSFFEFEDIICEVDDADLVAPRLVKQAPSRMLRRISNRAQRYLGLDIQPARRIEAIDIRRDYDLAIVIMPYWTGNMSLLNYVRGWREHCRTAVCWLHEVWNSWIREYGYRVDPGVLRQFDHVVIGLHGSVPMMSDYLGKTPAWLPGGIDALRYCPYPESPARVIDLYNMGRRSELTHESLLAWAHQENRFYLYDTVDAREAIDRIQHRELLAGLLKRTQFFVANKARANNPEVTDGQDEPGLRFFEGAAAGTIMIGDPPMKCEPFDALFDWSDAVIPTPFDTEAVPAVIAELEGDPERIRHIRHHNIFNSLTRFDWVYSWQKILELVGLSPTEKLTARVRHLHQIAERVSCETTMA